MIMFKKYRDKLEIYLLLFLKKYRIYIFLFKFRLDLNIKILNINNILSIRDKLLVITII
jgi:hypothetical protein